MARLPKELAAAEARLGDLEDELAERDKTVPWCFVNVGEWRGHDLEILGSLNIPE